MAVMQWNAESDGSCRLQDPIFESGNVSEAPLKLEDTILSGDVSTAPESTDLLIVGAGLSGAVLAERCSKELGMTSLIIDKRDHIGGNCKGLGYDYEPGLAVCTLQERVDSNGIRCSKYGAHLFHTQFERVWEYVSNFSEWIPFDHRVKGLVEDKAGVKRLTVNTLFEESVCSEADMQAWYDKERLPPPGGEPKNGEEAALSRVGPRLFEKVFKHYTKKQWDRTNTLLSWTQACPVAESSVERDEKSAAIRLRLRDPNISIRLNCDFFQLKEAGRLPKHKLLVYTGQIDSYYSALGMPKLEYRSLRFEEEFVPEPDGGFFQEAMVVNHPSPDVPFTRIVEYKHVPNQPQEVKDGKVKGTLIAREYSSAEGEPYYPVPNPANRALYEKYADLAAREEGVAFVGRLASYKYFNMDQAILNALEMFDNLKETGKLEPKRKPEDFGPGDGPK
ncbi:glf [Symbiodinium sp. CCMP2592]|nr:glf [Symbiodinium sp. CCMP2592]